MLDLSGGPIDEVYYVTGIALVGYFSHVVVKRSALSSIEIFNAQPVLFIVEFYLDVLLLLQSITIFNNNLRRLYFHALVPALLCFIYRIWVGAGSKLKKNPKSKPPAQKSQSSGLLGKKGFITAYRAQMMILTNLAILAVDFHAFPRRFAKVETWGTSIMDMGVGLFVFSMGLASSRSVIKKNSTSAKSLFSAYVSLIGNSVMKALSVLALGAIRLVSVKSLEYQEHVTEYGIHWNFFITLGVLPIFLAILDPLLNVLPRFFVGVAIGAGYEYTLQHGLQTYILNPSNRMENWLSMNKEGAFSFFGYASIFLIGQSFGSFVLTTRPTPNNLLYSGNSKRKIKWLTVSTTQGLLIMTGLLSAVFYWAFTSRSTGSILRRLANFPYVMWVASYNLAFLLGYHLIEEVAGPLNSTILEAINRNGLVVFLSANLLTGLVNMGINTLECGAGTTYVILIAYLLIWTGLALALDYFDLSIKI